MATIYRIPAPFSFNETVEVTGEPDMGWYEWQIVDAKGMVLKASKNMGYGSAEIALRDGLIAASL